MKNDDTEASAGSISFAKEFFLARQPILNRDQNLFAYELLFRSAASGGASVTDDLSATAAVIQHASELGMERVIGDSLGFINVDAQVLLSDFVNFLPREKVVLEILETVRATPEVVARVIALKKDGFVFALDDVIHNSEDVQQFLPLVDIIKVDIMGMPRKSLMLLTSLLKVSKKKMLAEKVENIEAFQMCLDLGFDYFQGYYFAKPVILTGKKIAPSELAIMHLMGLINADADSGKIEQSVKQDASLSLNLLRLVNSPAVGAGVRIDSLGQALFVLGRNQLQRWLQILLYAKPGKSGGMASPLLKLAITRGKLLELIAQKIKSGNRGMADTAFTVGVMSLMDTLFSLPMDELLTQMPVVEDVRNALLHRTGPYGNMLKLAECVEKIEEAGELLGATLIQLQLTAEDLFDLQLAAFEWADNLSQSIG